MVPQVSCYKYFKLSAKYETRNIEKWPSRNVQLQQVLSICPFQEFVN